MLLLFVSRPIDMPLDLQYRSSDVNVKHFLIYAVFNHNSQFDPTSV